MRVRCTPSVPSFGSGLLPVILLSAGPALGLAPGSSTVETRDFNPAVQAAHLSGVGSGLRAVGRTSPARARVLAALLESAGARPSPEDVARAFVDAHAEAFQQGAPRVMDASDVRPSEDLRTTALTRSGNRTHVRFAQTVAGLPVIGVEVAVHLDGADRVRSIQGGMVPREAVQAASFDEQVAARAASVASAHLGVEGLRGEIRSERAWLPTEQGLRAVYVVQVPAAEPLGDYSVYVDAGTGEVAAVDNALCTFELATRSVEATSKSTGTTRVYRIHPEAGGLEDWDLTDLGEDGTHLKGPYASVINEDADEAVSPEGSFVYDPTDTHFDEAMVYAHLETIHRFYKDQLGYSGVDFAIEATVHYGDEFDNAFYSPWSKSLAFGDGKKLNNLSREAGVVYHEYTHAVSGEMANLRWGEARSMNEGYSDYFACTQDEDPLIGEYIVKPLPDREYLRNLESTKHYPEDLDGEAHKDGEIWAATCWDLRKALGKEVTDRIVHESRNYLGGSANFKKGLQGILEADKAIYEDAHQDRIVEVFAARGIEVPGDTAEREQTRAHAFNELHGR